MVVGDRGLRAGIGLPSPGRLALRVPAHVRSPWWRLPMLAVSTDGV
jgi:hypothetical protein